MALLTAIEAAEILACNKRTLYHRHFRQAVGLRAIRLGGAIRFREEDVRAVLETQRERFDTDVDNDESA